MNTGKPSQLVNWGQKSSWVKHRCGLVRSIKRLGKQLATWESWITSRNQIPCPSDCSLAPLVVIVGTTSCDSLCRLKYPWEDSESWDQSSGWHKLLSWFADVHLWVIWGDMSVRGLPLACYFLVSVCLSLHPCPHPPGYTRWELWLSYDQLLDRRWDPITKCVMTQFILLWASVLRVLLYNNQWE